MVDVLFVQSWLCCFSSCGYRRELHLSIRRQRQMCIRDGLYGATPPFRRAAREQGHRLGSGERDVQTAGNDGLRDAYARARRRQLTAPEFVFGVRFVCVCSKTVSRGAQFTRTGILVISVVSLLVLAWAGFSLVVSELSRLAR